MFRGRGPPPNRKPARYPRLRAFIQFCCKAGLVGGRVVALDGTKMRVVASPNNIAGPDRLARDVSHTEMEIAYYLDRLDIMDEAVAQGFDNRPKQREAFTAALKTFGRRKDRLVRRQECLLSGTVYVPASAIERRGG